MIPTNVPKIIRDKISDKFGPATLYMDLVEFVAKEMKDHEQAKAQILVAGLQEINTPIAKAALHNYKLINERE